MLIPWVHCAGTGGGIVATRLMFSNWRANSPAGIACCAVTFLAVAEQLCWGLKRAACFPCGLTRGGDSR